VVKRLWRKWLWTLWTAVALPLTNYEL